MLKALVERAPLGRHADSFRHPPRVNVLGTDERYHPLLRHLDARSGVVALLLGACVGAEKRLESLEVGFCSLQLCSRTIRFGSGNLDLRLRLADLLRPRSGLERSQLSFRRRALGTCASDLQFGICSVESADQIARRDTIALHHAQLDQPPAHVWVPVDGDSGEESTQELAAAVGEEAILLPAAELLVRAVRIDLGSIDNQLQQLLGEIDKMAHGLADESGGAGLRLALILAMIAGAQLFRNDALAKRPASAVFMETDRASAWTRWSATTMRA